VCRWSALPHASLEDLEILLARTAEGWGNRVYTKSGYISSLTDGLVDALVDHAGGSPPGEDVFLDLGIRWRRRPRSRGRDRVPGSHRAVLGRNGDAMG